MFLIFHLLLDPWSITSLPVRTDHTRMCLFAFVEHWWFSGRILACHAGDPGPIPGQCRKLIQMCQRSGSLKLCYVILLIQITDINFQLKGHNLDLWILSSLCSPKLCAPRKIRGFERRSIHVSHLPSLATTLENTLTPWEHSFCCTWALVVQW